LRRRLLRSLSFLEATKILDQLGMTIKILTQVRSSLPPLRNLNPRLCQKEDQICKVLKILEDQFKSYKNPNGMTTLKTHITKALLHLSSLSQSSVQDRTKQSLQVLKKTRDLNLS
jgi:hypothetical protein